VFSTTVKCGFSVKWQIEVENIDGETCHCASKCLWLR